MEPMMRIGPATALLSIADALLPCAAAPAAAAAAVAAAAAAAAATANAVDAQSSDTIKRYNSARSSAYYA